MQTLGFETVNNKKIFFITNDLQNKKIVIMSHGFRSSNLGPARSFVVFEKLLNKEGFSTLRFDQYGNGNSEGKHIDSSFNEWVNTTSFFTQKYLDQGYEVILMGQSMGATTTMAVAGKKEFLNKIPCLLLWVPDPKIDVVVEAETTYEEAGELYKGKFWLEARATNFFESLEKYPSGIHLVYGEKDAYIAPEVREQVIAKAKAKGHPVMVLPEQGHSPWTDTLANQVYQEQIAFIKKFSQK